MSLSSQSRRGSASGKGPVHGDDGAAAVEMAIVLPVLLLIVFGIIDMGRLMNQQIQLTEAAREGARVGAVNGTVTDVKTKISSVVGSGVVLTYNNSTPTICGTGSAATADSSVNVQRTFVPITPLANLIQYLRPGSSTSTITIKAVGNMTCVG